MAVFEAELTDTFGGEANYAWVERRRFSAPSGASTRLLVRRAKAEVGLVGRHVTHDYGDMIEVRPIGSCLVLFVTYIGEEDSQ